MVRKRAPAQKALSPAKAASAKRPRKNSQNDEYVTQVQEVTEVKEEGHVNNIAADVTQSESIINGDLKMKGENDVVDSRQMENYSDDSMCYDELPDYNTFSKELTEKAKRYWDVVRLNYMDFTNWTCLLQTVTEAEDNLDAARGVYNCFLRYYPYCYGYWKKFSDIEKKNGNIDRAKKIFERGVQAISVSIDLWVHYLNFSIQQNKEKPSNQREIRDLFNQAIDAAGMEFKSNKLWDAYIEWEKSLGNLKHVTEIYDRLISTPTQQYIKNWQKFKEHLEAHPLADVLPTEEYVKLMQQMDAIPPGMTSEDDPSVITTAPPGEGNATNIVTEANESYSIDEDMSETETNNKASMDVVKSKVIAERESIFAETASEIKKRWKYEDAIKRPYFHVKPLEKSQLKNWREYLDYEIREGGQKRICFLFERCMVVCALYEDYWQKYLDYIVTCDVEAARTVFSRACNTHLLKKYKINICWSVFEEKQGNYEAASNILQNIDKHFPGMILITQRRVGLARRMHKFNDIVSIYENAINQSERIEDKIFYSIKFSHVLTKYCDDKSRAREVLWKALELGKKHKRIYLQLLDLEIHYGKVESGYVNKLFDSVEKDMSLNDDFRDSFGQRKVEFYEEYGDDIEIVIDVREDYQKQSKKREAIKRALSDSGLPESATKTTRTEVENYTLASQAANVNSTNTAPENYSYSQENPWYHAPAEGAYYGWGNYAQFGNYTQQ